MNAIVEITKTRNNTFLKKSIILIEMYADKNRNRTIKHKNDIAILTTNTTSGSHPYFSNIYEVGRFIIISGATLK